MITPPREPYTTNDGFLKEENMPSDVKPFFKPEDFHIRATGNGMWFETLAQSIAIQANRLVEPLLEENELLRVRIEQLKEVLEEEKESFDNSWRQP